MPISLTLNIANTEFDSDDNIIRFGNNDFEFFLRSIEQSTFWETEEYKISTWHIFLKFKKQYNKDPSTYISYKFLKQQGDFTNKKNVSDQLNDLYLNFSSEILEKNLNFYKNKPNPKIWIKYEEPVFHKNF